MGRRSRFHVKRAGSDDLAWHEAQMARGSLGPAGFVSWEQVEYNAIQKMTDLTCGGKAPDHKALLAKGWRMYRRLTR